MPGIFKCDGPSVYGCSFLRGLQTAGDGSTNRKKQKQIKKVMGYDDNKFPLEILYCLFLLVVRV